MAMKKKVFRSFLLMLLLVLLLSGCRSRVTGGSSGDTAASGSPAASDQGLSPQSDSEPQAEETQKKEDDSGSRTRENPDASRKEYDEKAPAEIAAGTGRLLHAEGDGSGAPFASEDAAESVSRLSDQAESSASRTVAASGSAERRGTSETAEAADSALTYYTVLLQSRSAAMFECQRLSVYLETPESHVTVHKSSPEHALILQAGAADVSARLLPENLRVDDGWVVRKNPGVIVKIVDGGILGSGVSSPAAAASAARQLQAREGWSGIDAVRSRRVLLLSQELLASPALRTAAALFIAAEAAPALYADVNPEQALAMLIQEETGSPSAGLFHYSLKGS